MNNDYTYLIPTITHNRKRGYWLGNAFYSLDMYKQSANGKLIYHDMRETIPAISLYFAAKIAKFHEMGRPDKAEEWQKIREKIKFYDPTTKKILLMKGNTPWQERKQKWTFTI